MNTKQVRIVDLGRGPQIGGQRLTVMDVFYYLHGGYDFDFIQQAMASLTREQFDSVVEYVDAHHEELVEKDRRMEEFHRRGMESQRASGGIFAESGENLTTEERFAQAQGKNEAEAASVGSGLAGVNLPSSLGARVCKTRSGNAIDLPSLSIPKSVAKWQSTRPHAAKHCRIVT